MSEVVPHANALVLAWLPGEEGGNGLADVLCGDVDASGRLPVTLLHTVGQVGVHSGAHHGGGRSMIMGDYVDAPASPLFPFGHGLSYTTWERSDLDRRAATTSDDVVVAVTVTNTGDRTGTDVVQVFFRDEVASVGLPAQPDCSPSSVWSAPPATRAVSRSECPWAGWAFRAATCATAWSPAPSPSASATSARRSP